MDDYELSSLLDRLDKIVKKLDEIGSSLDYISSQMSCDSSFPGGVGKLLNEISEKLNRLR
jgi:archaellum component FlaC